MPKETCALGRTAAEARLGLSSGHISLGHQLRFSKAGQFVEIKARLGKIGTARKVVKRGIVRGFSHGSRSRLMKLFAAADIDRLPAPLFITLTYPDTWVADWRQWKANLRDFLDALESKLGQVSMIWKMELQERGAPHFHLCSAIFP